MFISQRGMVGMSRISSLQYEIRFRKNQEYRNAVWQILCSRYFSRYVAENATVLDLGAGWGEFINNIRAGHKFAMDLNPATRTRLSKKITFLQQDCSRTWQIEANSLDVIFTSNFLEHLPDKERLEQVISEAHRYLKPNGLMICLGPNIKYVPGSYWDFWDHYIPLTELSVSELLRMQAFTVDQCIPRFLPFSMSTGITPPLFTVSLYLKMKFVWSLLGKQFLVVARKVVSKPEKLSNTLQRTDLPQLQPGCTTEPSGV